ncbi:Gonadotropin-releasing hormone II receptor [Lamellibrachia satsuma]|nr:Gonadotropin-releasing hormone II receptor [Lamellibrachia satsuma]
MCTLQSVIFHVEKHPVFEWFSQCVTFNFFPTRRHELAYNLFNIVAVYLAPLIVIVVSYSLILCEITRKTREGREQLSASDTKRRKPMSDFRRSGMGRIQKARSRTLKMTIVIVSVFIVCWTPYFVMSALWWFDQQWPIMRHNCGNKSVIAAA